MPELIFVGTGEACDPERPNTSLLYLGAQRLLLDSGYGVPHAFWHVSQDPDLLDAIFVSHVHADHAFGLPALLLWMRLARRERPLTVLGGPGLESWLHRLLELGYPGAFAPDRCYPILTREILPPSEHTLGALRLRTARSTHGVYNLALRIEEGPLAICYSGDGAPSEDCRELYREANLLVHECYCDLPEIEGHADARKLLSLARNQRVARLAFIHLGVPYRERILQRVRDTAADLDVLVPEPGDRLTL